MTIMHLHGEVTMSSGDGMSSSTLSTTRRAWVRMGTSGYAMSYSILNGIATWGSRFWGH
jgi:hypothetical protein